MSERERRALRLLRREVSETDAELAGLLLDRMETARSIGRLKTILGLPVEDPDREREVLELLRRRCRSEREARVLERVFREVIAVCREAQS
jgi:chorismate mutase